MSNDFTPISDSILDNATGGTDEAKETIRIRAALKIAMDEFPIGTRVHVSLHSSHSYFSSEYEGNGTVDGYGTTRSEQSYSYIVAGLWVVMDDTGERAAGTLPVPINCLTKL